MPVDIAWRLLAPLQLVNQLEDTFTVAKHHLPVNACLSPAQTQDKYLHALHKRYNILMVAQPLLRLGHRRIIDRDVIILLLGILPFPLDL